MSVKQNCRAFLSTDPHPIPYYDDFWNRKRKTKAIT